MIYIPFIYFSCLALWTYTRRHVVDMATICSLMFAVSGFFSILVDADNLRYWDSVYYEITPTAAASLSVQRFNEDTIAENLERIINDCRLQKSPHRPITI